MARSFFLVPSKKWYATYKVLWHGYPFRRCKVDILVPGIMNIPRVPGDRVEHQGGFPVMPLLPLLMLKLQAWEDHRNHHEGYMQVKQYVDISDIRSLLKIARRKGIRYGDPTQSWIPSTFVAETKRRVTLWAARVGDTENADWAAIGFEPQRQTKKPTTTDPLADLLRNMYIREF